MSYENILFERDGAVATITINRPKVLNALSQATIAELGAALREVEADDHLRVAIVTGISGIIIGQFFGGEGDKLSGRLCDIKCVLSCKRRTQTSARRRITAKLFAIGSRTRE